MTSGSWREVHGDRGKLAASNADAGHAGSSPAMQGPNARFDYFSAFVAWRFSFRSMSLSEVAWGRCNVGGIDRGRRSCRTRRRARWDKGERPAGRGAGELPRCASRHHGDLRRGQRAGADRLLLHAAGLRSRADQPQRADAGWPFRAGDRPLSLPRRARRDPRPGAGAHRQRLRPAALAHRPCGRDAPADLRRLQPPMPRSRCATSTPFANSWPTRARSRSSICRGCRSIWCSCSCCIRGSGRWRRSALSCSWR